MRVANGVVRGMGGFGLEIVGNACQIEGLMVTDSGGNGIQAYCTGQVLRTISRQNGDNGIHLLQGIVADSQAIGNAATGIYITGSALVIRNSSLSNRGVGVYSGGDSSLVGNTLIANPGGGFLVSANTGYGQRIAGAGDNVTVRNGAIVAMDDFGIWLSGRSIRIERVRAIGNAQTGILLSGEGSVTDSLAIANGTGITVVRGEVRGCVVLGGSAGIDNSSASGTPALVVTNSAVLASGFAVNVENGSIVENLIVGNANTGIRVFTAPPGLFASGFAGNVVNGSGGSAWTGQGVQTGPNVCLGNGGGGC